MKVFFGGVRGSMPCTGAGFQEFGGHTTCLLVTGHEGELLMFDTGSGVQVINPLLDGAERRHLLVLYTHLHLDHVLGLPNLAPLNDRTWRVDLAGSGRTGRDLATELAKIASPPLWPIPLGDMGARINFPVLPESVLETKGLPLQHGGLEIRGTRVPHPGGCLSWRVDEPATGNSLVFATDLEWSVASDEQRDDLVNLCRTPSPAQLLIMEGHFTDEELAQHAGWGHSSASQAQEVALQAGVKQLVITHHDPDKDDRRLTALENELRQEDPHVSLARQGQTLNLGT
nr:MBL fold metallo-hydrolase [Candidatus Krumholzibacteria bacterium]